MLAGLPVFSEKGGGWVGLFAACVVNRGKQLLDIL